MKTNQTIIIAMTAVLLLTLTGCQEPKGYLELKEPMKPVSEMTPATVSYTHLTLPTSDLV